MGGTFYTLSLALHSIEMYGGSDCMSLWQSHFPLCMPVFRFETVIWVSNMFPVVLVTLLDDLWGCWCGCAVMECIFSVGGPGMGGVGKVWQGHSGIPLSFTSVTEYINMVYNAQRMCRYHH